MKSKVTRVSKRSGKRKRKPSRIALCRKADAAWKAYIHAAFGGRCAINDGTCSRQLHPHHLISRSNRRYRHDPMNGVLLCALHHLFSHRLSAHKAPIALAVWLKDHLPAQWAWAVSAVNEDRIRAEHSEGQSDDSDYEKACALLEQLTESISTGRLGGDSL